MSWLPSTTGRAHSIYVLPYCTSADSVYGATMTFKTLRVGFPDAEVFVIDNNTCQEAEVELVALAKQNDCRYHRLDQTIKHYTFLSEVVLNPANHGTVIILDPDMCFWERVDHWEFDGLLAGRLVPAFYEEFSGCINLPRLHTSFWWIPDVARLRDRIVDEFKRTSLGYLDAFAPFIFKDTGNATWYKFDAGSNLCAAIEQDLVLFGERELNAFDHLLVGSHMELVIGSLGAYDQFCMRMTHDWARHDPSRLRGIWRAQDTYFAQRAVPTHALRSHGNLRLAPRAGAASVPAKVTS